jgi:hypothetical protein
MGRPTKLTAELRTKICDELRKGLFRRHAAALAGIPEATLSGWYHRGANEKSGVYRDFFEAVDHSEATFAQTSNDMLKAAAAQNPKFLQWLMSRRFPELYGRRDNVEDKSIEDRAAQAQATRQLLVERLERLFPDPEAKTEAPPAPAAPPKPDAQ